MVLPRWEMVEVDGSGLAAMKTAFVVSLFCILPLLPGTQAVDQHSPQRTYPVLRLQPAAFPELPKNLVSELENRGCTIPQPYTDRRANVIWGEFVKPGQTDWAVLCSTKGYTNLLVFWNGSATNSVELAKNPDNPGRIDLFIRPVDRKFIMITTGHTVGQSRRQLTIRASNRAAKRRPWCCTTTGASGSSCKGRIDVENDADCGCASPGVMTVKYAAVAGKNCSSAAPAPARMQPWSSRSRSQLQWRSTRQMAAFVTLAHRLCRRLQSLGESSMRVRTSLPGSAAFSPAPGHRTAPPSSEGRLPAPTWQLRTPVRSVPLFQHSDSEKP